MSSQYSQASEDISTAIKACEAWTATEVMLQVATSLSDDTPVQVDLMETLKCKKTTGSQHQINQFHFRQMNAFDRLSKRGNASIAKPII